MPAKEKFNPKDFMGKDYKPPMGDYTPSGVFSFEFRERLNPFFVTEISLLLPPESTQIQYGYRLTVHKTIGGTTFDFMGVDNPTITLSGSLWSPWIDILPDPFGSGVALQSARGGLADLAALASKAVQSFFPLNQMSGLDEFFRMKYMLFDFFNPDSKFAMPASLDSFGPLPGLHFMLYWAIVGKNNLTDIQLIYRDYDDDVHWEVVPQGLNIARDKKDPFTTNWQITLVGIKDLRALPLIVQSLSKKINSESYVDSLCGKLIGLTPYEIAKDQWLGLEAYWKDAPKLEWSDEHEFQVAIDKFQDKSEANKDELIFLGEKYNQLALNAGEEIKDSVLVDAGLDPANYKTDSESASPPQAIIDLNDGPTMSQLAEYLINSAGLMGANAYMGNQEPVQGGVTGNTVLDLPEITEETFSVGESQAGAVKYATASWRTYTVKQDDNLGKIAVRQLGDYTRFPEIAKLNHLYMSDFLLDGMIGQTIKLPERRETIFNNKNNLVYYHTTNYDDLSSLAVSEETLGRDIPLNDDRDFIIDNSGDLAMVLPEDSFIENVNDVLSYPIGTLPLYPEWGLTLEIGKLNNITAKVIMQKVRVAAKYDPRVQDIRLYPDDILVEGDVISFRVTILSIMGSSSSITI